MLVVVGGHSRNIGKTTVAAGLITAIPEAEWGAIKITQYGHNVCQDEGEACSCAPGDPAHRVAVDQQREPDATDTGRFLAAGARRAWWIRTAQGDLGHALPELKKLFSGGGNWMVESNSLLRFYKPDLYIVVLDFANPDMKDSARLYFDRADAYLIAGGEGAAPWNGIPRRWLDAKPRFHSLAELAEFVRSAYQRVTSRHSCS